MKLKTPSEADVLSALAGLAQAQRLRAFRALVVAGAEGLNAGTLAQQLGIAPSALSFHLKELTHAGLITSEAQGRFIVYRASFNRMNGLLAYLTEHCCQGQACEVSPGGCTDC
jgi:ArsR family transcriptional regulator